MTEVYVIAAAAVLICSISSHAFHSWLRQRERERLSATDKVALEARLAELESKVREVKNTLPAVRRG